MKNLKRYTIVGIIFVIITGTLAHFLYVWTGNNHPILLHQTTVQNQSEYAENELNANLFYSLS